MKPISTPVVFGKDGSEVQYGMTPKQILAALRFLEHAQNNCYRSNPMWALYADQIERLLYIQRIQASVMITEKAVTDETTREEK